MEDSVLLSCARVVVYDGSLVVSVGLELGESLLKPYASFPDRHVWFVLVR